jgi:NAD(P)H dehydrogenase (quinone)
MHDPTRRILKRGLAALCHPACRTVYLALHHRDRAGDKRRRRFMDRVRRALAEV